MRRRTNVSARQTGAGFCGDVCSTLQLNLEAPERGVRLDQLKAYVPRFVVAPDYFRFGLAAGFRMDQADFSMQRQVRSDHGHAPGVADIHRYCVGAVRGGAFIPFDQKLYLGDYALMAS